MSAVDTLNANVYLAELAAELGVSVHEKSDDDLQRELLAVFLESESRAHQIEQPEMILRVHRVPQLDQAVATWQAAAAFYHDSAKLAKKRLTQTNILFAISVTALGCALVSVIGSLNR